jgi:hypothetical protein
LAPARVDRNDHWLLSRKRYGRKMFKPTNENGALPIERIRRVLSVEAISDLQRLCDAPLP